MKGSRCGAAYFGNPPEKPKEEAMKFEDFLTAAKDFVKAESSSLNPALDLFGAKDKLITDKQKAALDALGEDDPKALKDQLAEAKKKAVNAELDQAFGKDGNLRMYADEQIEKGKTIDEIARCRSPLLWLQSVLPESTRLWNRSRKMSRRPSVTRSSRATKKEG